MLLMRTARANNPAGGLAWLLILALTVAAPALVRAEGEGAKPTPEQLNLAKQLNKDGERLFNLGKFKEAAAAYAKAHEAVPLPGFLHNLGQCHARMDTVRELDKAVFYFESYLARQPDAANGPEVKEEIARLERKIETLRDYKKPVLLGVNGGPLTRTVEPAPKSPIYKKWWFWTIVGAVVAGAAAGTVVALQPGENPPVDGSLWPKVVSFD
jgi:hypothetical protein